MIVFMRTGTQTIFFSPICSQCTLQNSEHKDFFLKIISVFFLCRLSMCFPHVSSNRLHVCERADHSFAICLPLDGRTRVLYCKLLDIRACRLCTSTACLTYHGFKKKKAQLLPFLPFGIEIHNQKIQHYFSQGVQTLMP